MLVVFPFISCADEPPAWENFVVKSANQSFIANVTLLKRHKTKNRSQGKYILSVRDQNTKNILWSCEYKYDGYAQGLLSNDGSTFIYVNDWYFERFPIISIYQGGLLKKEILGKDLSIDPHKLISSSSHYLWLDQSQRYSLLENQGKSVLKVYTVDGKVFLVDLSTLNVSVMK